MVMITKSKSARLGVVCIAAVMLTVGYLWGHTERSTEQEIGLVNAAEAAGGKVNGPNEIAPDRYVYFPGTEV